MDRRGRAWLLCAWVLASAPGLTQMGCQSAPEAPSRREAVEAYLRDHPDVAPDRRRALRNGLPDRGMSVAEAEMALGPLETLVTRDDEPMVAVTRGPRPYYLTFSGEPPRLVHWSAYAPDEVQVTDPRELRPEPPIRLPRE